MTIMTAGARKRVETRRIECIGRSIVCKYGKKSGSEFQRMSAESRQARGHLFEGQGGQDINTQPNRWSGSESARARAKVKEKNKPNYLDESRGLFFFLFWLSVKVVFNHAHANRQDSNELVPASPKHSLFLMLITCDLFVFSQLPVFCSSFQQSFYTVFLVYKNMYFSPLHFRS